MRIPVKLDPAEQAIYESAGRHVAISCRLSESRAKPNMPLKTSVPTPARTPRHVRRKKSFYLRKSIEDRAREKLRMLEDSSAFTSASASSFSLGLI